MDHPARDLHAELAAGRARLAVIGLGYVGLPLAVCLAKRFPVVGFDVKASRVQDLRSGIDATGEVDGETLRATRIAWSTEPGDLAACRLLIVTVPTPVDKARRPDFSPLLSASAAIGRQIRRGTTVVFESTVYPGATEEVCIPEIERVSGLAALKDFAYGYSPERINPGDRQHAIDKVTKVVSGCDATTLEEIARIYGDAIPAGVFKAANVKVAEAAKVIENTQRDLNIALVNELSLIFHRIGIDTVDVLAAAGTKWNFLPFRPGLVGGHCIGVDPYYLTHKAEELDYTPEVILAGRRINDGMGRYVAQECVRLLATAGRAVSGARVLVLGLTFKENVRDVRNTKVVDIVAELKRFGVAPIVVDPVADAPEAMHEYGIELQPMEPLPRADAVIAAVGHAAFAGLTPQKLAGCCAPGTPFLDVKSAYDRAALSAAGFTVWRL